MANNDENRGDKQGTERARDEARKGGGPRYAGGSWGLADEREPGKRFGHARTDDSDPSEVGRRAEATVTEGEHGVSPSRAARSDEPDDTDEADLEDLDEDDEEEETNKTSDARKGT
jgi:hypothetical protein